ncbi:hypothetical protein BDN72DRAFT_851455 [Pluteus cervinus]|uniref:Uncharacterized protein n=1 Tax=Pluteus cervinus TaxID=181527 RepID=A0ACD2ZZW9_9AGAR|nr:hypothetical protein BDN72DRAFT_851455 [Pluteus cervinus]
MSQYSMQNASAAKEPHERFYIVDDFVILEVESTLFRLPAFILKNNSPKLNDLIGTNRGTIGIPRRVELKSVSVINFERFLLVLFSTRLGEYEISLPGEWASVLKIANDLDFPAVRKLAIAQLEAIASPIERIVLGRKYDFSKLVTSGYIELCRRDAPITLLEGHKLGTTDIIDISSIRHHLRSTRSDAEITKDSVIEICSEPGRQVLEHNAVADFVAAVLSDTGDPPSLPNPYIPPPPSLPDSHTPPLPSLSTHAVPVISVTGTSGHGLAGSPKVKSHKGLANAAWRVRHKDANFEPFWRRTCTSPDDQRFWMTVWETHAKKMDQRQIDALVRTKLIQDMIPSS